MTKQIFFLNILLAFLILTHTSSAYSYLTVNDPRNWNSMPGTIEQATITVKPKGIFMEIGLYLTFSARGWYAGSNDSLEIVSTFSCPRTHLSMIHGCGSRKK